MKKKVSLLFGVMLSIFCSPEVIGSDTLQVSRDEIINQQVLQLSYDLELSKEQETSIKQILSEESKMKSTKSSDIILPPFFNILNKTQQDNWIRYYQQQIENNSNNTNLKSTSTINSEYTLALSGSEITDVRVVKNHHSDGSNSENKGYPTFSRICAVAWSYKGANMFYRSYLRFLLESIPVGSTIVKATFYLYSDPTQSSSSSSDGNSKMSGTNACSLDRVTEDWAESSITWNAQPNTTAEDRVQISESASTTENIQLDLTGMIQYWVNSPSLNYGAKLQLQTEVRYRSRNYASTDHSNSSLHPRLVIYYNEPNSNVEYTYDDAGNRVSRQTLVLRTLKSSTHTYEQVQQHKVKTELYLKGSLEECSISLFPNPTHGNLNLQFDKLPSTTVYYELRDLAGITKLKGDINNAIQQQLQLGKLSPGVYILNLKQGTISISYKIIKQ